MKSKKKETLWENVPDNVQDYKGFIYLITNKLNNKKYIGKKFFWHTRKIKVKNRKNRKWVVKESDWKYYKSSSKELIEDIKKYGEENFKFEILKPCITEKQLTLEETSYQFKYDVLTSKLNEEEYEYYNDNILGKFFRKDYK